MFVEVIQTILLVLICWFLLTRVSEGDNWLKQLVGGKQRCVILDSCALIDGRIIEVVGSHFVVDTLIIPQFILNELQLLADGHDSHKRERARFGLDIANQLQDTAPKVLIDRTVFEGSPTTDDKLVLLAKKLKAQLYTTDYNLAKVALVEGVQILNVNELAQNLRPISLPGETLQLKILQKGSNRDQGVGYLDDGTMIVVDGGARHIGRVVPVTVTRMHQTMAGKMVFGQIRHASNRSSGEPQPRASISHNRPSATHRRLSAAPQHPKRARLV